MSTPCYNCPDRVLGCHSTCEKYLSFRKERDKVLAAKYKEQRELDHYIDSISRKKHRKR